MSSLRSEESHIELERFYIAMCGQVQCRKPGQTESQSQAKNVGKLRAVKGTKPDQLKMDRNQRKCERSEGKVGGSENRFAIKRESHRRLAFKANTCELDKGEKER